MVDGYLRIIAMIHEDERRTLTSIPYKTGEIKIIVAKQDCELGNHFHKVKTERFILLQGEGLGNINGNKFSLDCEYMVKQLEKHSFFLKKDSILFCICSHPYDKNDDYEY